MLLVFAVFAVLMYLRWVPALVAVPAMAILMALVAGVPVPKLGEIVSTGAIKLAPFYVAVIFGALLGRVTIETGIARAIVDLAAEYGGEKPFALALGFSAIVAVLFTSLSGLGGIIMVGSIVLPIMMTAGDPTNGRGHAIFDELCTRLYLQHRELDVLHDLLRNRAGAAHPLRGCAGRDRRARTDRLRDRCVPARARVRDLGGSRQTRSAAAESRQSP